MKYVWNGTKFERMFSKFDQFRAVWLNKSTFAHNSSNSILPAGMEFYLRHLSLHLIWNCILSYDRMLWTEVRVEMFNTLSLKSQEKCIVYVSHDSFNKTVTKHFIVRDTASSCSHLNFTMWFRKICIMRCETKNCKKNLMPTACKIFMSKIAYLANSLRSIRKSNKKT